MAMADDNEILEGFLCPICMADLKSPTQLSSHFESVHQEEQELLKSLSFKDIFGKAKRIFNDDADNRDFLRIKNTLDPYVYRFEDEQSVGVSRSSTDYFLRIRSSRLERYDTETNKLLIRLDKLICNMPTDRNQRKQYEMDVVPWLDGTSVKLCPSCAKTFNITRRKHHCRLCGSILCHDCSVFLDLNIAKSIVDPSAPRPSQLDTESLEKNGLRLCEHCSNLIDLRRQVQESRNAKSTLMAAYEQMRSFMEQATPKVAMYEKMCDSLFNGETTYNLSDVNAVRGVIGKLAESIDVVSKQILAVPADPGSRQAKLNSYIRQSATQYIKDELLSLRKLPTEAEIEESRRKRHEEAKRRISMERRLAEMETVEETAGNSAGPSVRPDVDDVDNPLLEQINIVRGFINEARKGLRFEEVAILEANLKDLKKEYQLQKLSKA